MKKYDVIALGELYSGAWNGRAAKLGFKGHADICQYRCHAHYNEKRGAQGNADQGRSRKAVDWIRKVCMTDGSGVYAPEPLGLYKRLRQTD